MKDELFKLIATSVSSFALGAGTFAYTVSGKASLWEHDKPYISEQLKTLGADVKTMLSKMATLEEAIRERGDSRRR